MLLALPDKFRGTATAREVGETMASAADDADWQCLVLPISDGGEGLLDCFGGPNRTSPVTGPLGSPVPAAWRLNSNGTAVIEMATASGLALVAGRNDPLAATSRGTGELIAAALDAGATEVLVGVGGSASTDGGLGAVEVLADRAPLTTVTVAADVTTLFTDAARLFGPQKGATGSDVTQLTERLTTLAERYVHRFGVDVTHLPGAGAAGGLAGGLAALGAQIRPGFDVVAAQLELATHIGTADLVLTGEGRLDATSLLGKASVAVARMCTAAGTPVALIVGAAEPGIDTGVPMFSLTARFGHDAALADTLPGISALTAEVLASHRPARA